MYYNSGRLCFIGVWLVCIVFCWMCCCVLLLVSSFGFLLFVGLRLVCFLCNLVSFGVMVGWWLFSVACWVWF